MEKKKTENFSEEYERQMYSFAEALATVIDERTPYNGNHTRRVVEYTRMLVDRINELYRVGQYDYYFDNDEKEPLILAAFLHDIGKTITPLAVMNKPTRLSTRMEKIRSRFRYLKALMEIDSLKGRMEEDTFQRKVAEIDELYRRIMKMNKADELSWDDMDYVNVIGENIYITPSGKKIHYLTKYEIECLNIHTGTLTNSERELMEQHVVFTEKILSKVLFSNKFSKVTMWASRHHEYLDGSGYPYGLTGEDLDIPTRVLTIVDVYDALTSPDRPYKDGWSYEDALDMLDDMADEGKLDKRLVDIFTELIRNREKS